MLITTASKKATSVSEFLSPSAMFTSVAIDLGYTVTMMGAREEVFKCVQ